MTTQYHVNIWQFGNSDWDIDAGAFVCQTEAEAIKKASEFIGDDAIDLASMQYRHDSNTPNPDTYRDYLVTVTPEINGELGDNILSKLTNREPM